ncbi:MAG: hypothetical protein G8D27_01505 [Buchnera aphidicola (Periphyllus aceris)]|nr:hypothetical protein [Buchnera aphidicola (Periphyllus aceris)]
MNRVVVTGLGILSSIGNNKTKVLKSLKNGKCGIVFSQEMKDFGLKSNVWGKINFKYKKFFKKKFFKYMNLETIYAYLAMKEAINDSLLNDFEYKHNKNVGLIIGTGFCSSRNNLLSLNYANQINNNFYKKFKSGSIYTIFQIMNSSVSACLSTLFKINGISYSISSACATSSNCIGHAYELIRSGKQNIVFSGGSEAITLNTAFYFDLIKVLSKKYNNFPKRSSRVFDLNRDGFVISEGSGILVLEELNSALSRNAHIYGEIIEYNTNSDGFSMFSSSKKGMIRCMKNSIRKISTHIDCINVHATSTKLGDLQELNSIKKVFQKTEFPLISSTKSMTGHSLGASGVHEIIFLLLMLENNFIAPAINIDILDPKIQDLKIIKTMKKIDLNVVMSNSFGFGGVNTTLILKKFNF